MLQNHDLLKLWFEDQSEKVVNRLSFSLRVIKWIASLCILYIATYLLINPQNSYY